MTEDRVSLSSLPPPNPPVVPQDLAAESVPLPSRGLVYPAASPLHRRESVEIRAMTARDEDILTSRALLKSGKAISALIQGCLLLPGVDAGEMLAGDRNAVLIGIRISGYGAEYQVKMDCPGCGDRVERVVDLSQLPLKRFPEGVAPVQPGANEFAFTLPSGRGATFKLMTGADETELLATFERNRKAGIQDELVTTRLKAQLLSLGGERDPAAIAKVVRTLPARDSRALRAHIDRITPGVELVQSFTCPACGYEAGEVEVPLGTEFFWPKA